MSEFFEKRSGNRQWSGSGFKGPVVVGICRLLLLLVVVCVFQGLVWLGKRCKKKAETVVSAFPPNIKSTTD